MRTSFLTTVLALAVTPMFGTSAIAQTLPASQISGNLQLIGAQQNGSPTPSTQSTSIPGVIGNSITAPGEAASGSLNVQTGPAPSVSASAQVSASGANTTGQTIISGTGGPSTVLTYSIEFLGPTPTVNVQVNATVSASTSASPVNGGLGLNRDFATFSVVGGANCGAYCSLSDSVSLSNSLTSNGYVANASFVQTLNSTTTSSSSIFSGAYTGQITDTRVWTAATGVIYTVALNLGQNIVANGGLGGGTLSTSASIDPTLLISSSTANSNLYSVVLSSGIGNTNPVPEPSSWALSMIGITLVALAVRRRTKADRYA